MGVIPINAENLNIEVGAIFKKAFIDMTSRLSSVELNEEKKQKNVAASEETRIMILTKGSFQSYIVCSMDKELGEVIVLGMNNGKPLEQEEKELYIKEYINIICGHGLSYINGCLGTASRLSVPYLVQQEAKVIDPPETDREETFSLDCEYGTMNVTVHWSDNV